MNNKSWLIISILILVILSIKSVELFFDYDRLDEGTNIYLLIHGSHENGLPMFYHFLFHYIGGIFGHSVLGYRISNLNF